MVEKLEGVMLSITDLNHFYYVRDFIDMRCKHSRVLSIIRERLHREPSDGDVFIVMSRNRWLARSLQEKLDYTNQELFGDRGQKRNSKARTSASDRKKEKDDYDGIDDTLCTDSVDNNKSQEVKEFFWDELSNRPEF